MNTTKLFSDWSEVTSGNRNEIVFERLNKIYGAYEIRTNYDRALAKAFSSVLLLMGLLAALFFIAHEIPQHEKKIPFTETVTFQPPVAENPLIPKQPEQPVQHSSASASNENLAPEITDTEEPSTIIPENPVSNPVAPGPETNNPPSNPPSIGGGGNLQPVDSAITFPDIMPEFPGGNEALFHYLRTNTHIAEEVVELGNMREKVCVAFVVNKEGNVIEASLINGGSKIFQLNNEALRVVNKMPKWEPGKQNGNPVKVRMVLPIRFEVK